MERDPIRLLADRIYALGIANEEQLKAIDDDVKQEVADAVKFADESPQPDPSTLFDDIYYEPDQPDPDEKIVPIEKRRQQASA